MQQTCGLVHTYSTENMQLEKNQCDSRNCVHSKSVSSVTEMKCGMLCDEEFSLQKIILLKKNLEAFSHIKLIRLWRS
jgi:hypothetical protein